MVTLGSFSGLEMWRFSIFCLKDSPGIRRTDGRPQSLPSQLDDFAFLELLVHLRESISLTCVPRGRTCLFVPCKAEKLPGWRTGWSCLLATFSLPCSPAVSVRALCSGGPQSLSKRPPGFTPHGCSSGPQIQGAFCPQTQGTAPRLTHLCSGVLASLMYLASCYFLWNLYEINMSLWNAITPDMKTNAILLLWKAKIYLFKRPVCR